MARPDYPSSRVMPAARLDAAQATSLIQVSWDSSPNLDEFLRFISAYAKGRFSSGQAERITLASNELLDNALRYGSLARDFSYRLDVGTSLLSVCVQNTTVLTRIEMLTSQLRRLESSPELVYASELERSTHGGGRRSMLGLARIRHEGEMQLELTLDGLDVTMCAHCKR